MSVILITGASTGIGNLSAKALAAAGHTVYASMRDVEGRNADRADDLLAFAKHHRKDIRVIELDVQSQDSADRAVQAVLDDVGMLDVVIHNAGHMSIGYTEAFTVDELAHQFDVNAFSVHRVNRAALPHLRDRGSGTLLYVGSTTTVSVPPFLGPYVASKFAFDALAQVTAYEVSQFGIETVIVMPGAFTQGTDHFPNASHALDESITRAYSRLDPMLERYGDATEALFEPGSSADPSRVADEIVRVLALPFGQKPRRTVVDFTRSDVAEVNEANEASSRGFLTRMGYGDLLEVRQ